jgi:hypothetical protein
MRDARTTDACLCKKNLKRKYPCLILFFILVGMNEKKKTGSHFKSGIKKLLIH